MIHDIAPTQGSTEPVAIKPQWLSDEPLIATGYISRFHRREWVNVGQYFSANPPSDMSPIAGGYTESSRDWLANLVADLEAGKRKTVFVISPLPDGLAVFRVRIEPEYGLPRP